MVMFLVSVAQNCRCLLSGPALQSGGASYSFGEAGGIGGGVTFDDAKGEQTEYAQVHTHIYIHISYYHHIP